MKKSPKECAQKMTEMVQDLLPSVGTLTLVMSETGTPKNGAINGTAGFDLWLPGNACDRKQARAIYEGIRSWLPDLYSAYFKERCEMEWEYSLHFETIVN